MRGGGRSALSSPDWSTSSPSRAGLPEATDEVIDAPVGATVLRTNDPATALVAFAETLDEAIFVLTSDRWPGGRSHWYSTTRRVVQTTSRPVLVVPSDLPS